MTSVLESVYYQPNRPYSQNELNNMRASLYSNILFSKALSFKITIEIA